MALSPLAPRPLLRHGADGHLRLHAEGLELLRKASAPVHVVFAIGGSRCGKSTASNALIFGAEAEVEGFETGNSFEPVTNGVDVAVRPLPGGGSLVVGDCEGAFHIGGSALSARGFGLLGLLAYHLSTALLHVSMGSIDERDIEVLGHLAACASTAGRSVHAASPACEKAAPPLPALPSPARLPELVLLVNGARFDLGSAVARRLLRPPEGEGDDSRWCARAAIARGFSGQPALEALPACEHAAYWRKVETLRKRIVEAAPAVLHSGAQATGSDLAARITRLVAALNGEAGGAGAALLRQPEPATEAFYRSAHLEPLVEELCQRFAAASTAIGDAGGRGALQLAQAGAEPPRPVSPTKSAMADTLAEFDRRAALLAEDGASQGGAPVLRQGLVAKERARLAAQLASIREALVLGKSLGGARRPRSQRRPSPAGSLCDSYFGKENVTPSTTPGTTVTFASSTRVAGFEQSIAAMEEALEASRQQTAAEIGEARADCCRLKQREQEEAACAARQDREVAAAVTALQERGRLRIGEEVAARAKSAGEQATAVSTVFAELEEELDALRGGAPLDVESCAARLAELRRGLEAARVQRQERVEAATGALEKHTRGLWKAVEHEGESLAALRNGVEQRLDEAAAEMRGCIEEERRQRNGRCEAMAEVVDRVRASLEASLEVSEPPVEVVESLSLSQRRASYVAASGASDWSSPTTWGWDGTIHADHGWATDPAH